MAPSADLVSSADAAGYTFDREHISKKRKLQPAQDADMEETSTIESGVPPHPLGIKPLGNAYEAKFNLKAFCGSFARLPDEMLVQLFEYLDARDLKNIGATCRTLYAFSRAEELWKPLFIECVHLALKMIRTNVFPCAFD